MYDAGVKHPALKWLMSRTPNASYAMCTKSVLHGVKDTYEATVLVPPEEQRWQQVRAAQILEAVCVPVA